MPPEQCLPRWSADHNRPWHRASRAFRHLIRAECGKQKKLRSNLAPWQYGWCQVYWLTISVASGTTRSRIPTATASVGGLYDTSLATAILALDRIDFAARLHRLHYHGKSGAIACRTFMLSRFHGWLFHLTSRTRLSWWASAIIVGWHAPSIRRDLLRFRQPDYVRRRRVSWCATGSARTAAAFEKWRRNAAWHGAKYAQWDQAQQWNKSPG
jgi:hypothetical protein